jgi:hypothetical protein
MQTTIISLLLFLSGAVSAGSKKLLRLAEFITDIYQQFPHSCKFIIDSERRHEGENEFFYYLEQMCEFIEQ